MRRMVTKKSVSKLGKIRENAGFDQKDIAAKYGVDPSYISRLETGKVGMTPTWAQRFANDYGITLEGVFSCVDTTGFPPMVVNDSGTQADFRDFPQAKNTMHKQEHAIEPSSNKQTSRIEDMIYGYVMHHQADLDIIMPAKQQVKVVQYILDCARDVGATKLSRKFVDKHYDDAVRWSEENEAA